MGQNISRKYGKVLEPVMVVSDGGSGFNKALRKTWPHMKHQRCLFHVFSQIKRYTTTRPKTLAGIVKNAPRLSLCGVMLLSGVNSIDRFLTLEISLQK